MTTAPSSAATIYPWFVMASSVTRVTTGSSSGHAAASVEAGGSGSDAQGTLPRPYHPRVTPELHIAAAVARRFFVTRHLLAPPRSLPARPESVMTFFDRFGTIQFDPLDITGRNHDLVLQARIAGYRREWTDALLYESRDLFETFNKMLSIVPTAELPYYRIAWDRSRAQHEGGTFDEHAPLVEEMLTLIRDNGPLLPRTVEPRERIDWYWRPTNQVRAILEALAEAGILGIARRQGNLRVYELIERLFPEELLAQRPPARDQLRHKLLSRYRAHGLLGATGPYEIFASTYFGKALGLEDGLPTGTAAKKLLLAELVESGALVPVAIEGVRVPRHVIASELPLLDQAEREVAAGERPNGRPPGVAFLAPLDQFCWDRQFMRELFGFDYIWEVYVPAKKRRWGYYVLPILFGDRLVGRIEPRFERRAGTLRVVDLWWEDGFDPLDADGFVAAFVAALEAHRDFGGLQRIAMPRFARHRLFATAVRERLAL